MHRITILKETVLKGTICGLKRENNTNKLERSQLLHKYTLFVLQILHKLLFSNALGRTAYSPKHVKTMFSAKFGGQTWDLMRTLQITKGHLREW